MKTKSSRSTRSKGKENRGIKLPAGWRNLISNNRFVLFMTTILLFVVFVYLASNSTPIALKAFKVGDVIEADIQSSKTFIDEAQYEKLKAKALENVQPITTVDLTVQLFMRQRMTEFFDHLISIKTSYQSEKLSILQKIYIATVKDNGMNMTEDTLKALISLKDEEIIQDLQTVNEVVAQVMVEGVSEEGLTDARARISDTLVKLEVAVPVVDAVNAVMAENIRANVVVDEKKTSALREKAIESVMMPSVEKGSLLAIKGQVVDEELYARLSAAGYGSYGPYTRFGYTIMVQLTILLILGLYYSFSSTYLIKGLSSKRILLSTTIILITVFINRFVGLSSPYLVHICLYTLTMCMFYNRMYAVIVSLILASLTLLIEPVPVAFALYAPLSAVACGLMLKEVHQRSSILYAGGLVSLFSILIGGVFLLAAGEGDQNLFRDLLFLFANGFFYAILTIGTLPIFEFVFKLITPIKLLELSSPNQPLLKLLLIEAPGSYHHSIIVGNMSDEAARAIGADSLLARVGAYYHDIGKTYKPYFFKENQLGIDNPHDSMSAHMSAGVIKNHVVYGVELAKSHHMPEEIISFIESHHGTTMIKYFYHKAIKDNEEVEIKDYAYDGKLPLTKELAIVMLADTVEAVSRTLDAHSNERHESMLNKVFQDKFETGQLKESPLTFVDIEKIKTAFLKTLSGLYHERIVYPEDIKKGEDTQNGFVDGERTGESSNSGKSN